MSRAFLAAIATAARLYPRRSTSSRAQRLRRSFLSGNFAITAWVPWINNVRRYLSPRLVILPSWTLPPVEYCRGTRPSQAAKCRPLLNCLGAGALASMAVAVWGPDAWYGHQALCFFGEPGDGFDLPIVSQDLLLKLKNALIDVVE
jgi:hypothetical protein